MEMLVCSCFLDVTTQQPDQFLTEFLPDLQGTPAAAFCLLPLSSEGVIYHVGSGG